MTKVPMVNRTMFSEFQVCHTAPHCPSTTHSTQPSTGRIAARSPWELERKMCEDSGRSAARSLWELERTKFLAVSYTHLTLPTIYSV